MEIPEIETLNLLEKIQLVQSNLAECVGNDEIRTILEERPLKVYWGTAPTGQIHIGYLIPLIKIAQLLRAGCQVKILIADLHAFLDAQKSTLAQLEARTKYYKMVIETILKDIFHVDVGNITFVQGREYQLQPSYTMDMYKMSSIASLHQTQRAGSEVVKSSDNPHLTGLLYPILQALDEEYLDVDIQVGGVDQRKILMFAREMLPKIGYKKRIHLMTSMMSCIRSTRLGEREIDGVTTKMSSSFQDSRKIGVLDSKSQIKRKIRRAFCIQREVDDNCWLEMMETCLFRSRDHLRQHFSIPRAEEFGGKMVYETFNDLRENFFNGNLHPMDLKNGISDLLTELLEPLRDMFLTKEGKALLAEAYSS